MTGVIIDSKRHLVTEATEKRTPRIRKHERPPYPQGLVTQSMPERCMKFPKLLRCSAFMLDAQGLPARVGYQAFPPNTARGTWSEKVALLVWRTYVFAVISCFEPWPAGPGRFSLNRGAGKVVGKLLIVDQL